MPFFAKLTEYIAQARHLGYVSSVHKFQLSQDGR